MPTRDNAGKPFPPGRWRELERRLLAFGGFTFADGMGGAWRADGQLYRGRNREYEVDLASWRQLAEWLALADWVRESFLQQALYAEVAGVPEILE